MKDNKKVIAAMAAVTYYLQEQEAAMAQQAAAGSMPQFPAAQLPAVTVKPWGLNGRQTQMQLRNLMQLRTFR